MRFGVLGPLEVEVDGNSLSLGTRKRQSVLALLAVNAGRPVTIDDLVDELWPERPPASAVANTRGYASGLRRLFETAEPTRDRLIRRGSGYLLRVDSRELDLAAFLADAAAGQEALRRGDARAAVAHLSTALALWRGPMVSGLPRGPILAPRCTAVEEERWAVTERLAEAHLGLDRPGEAVTLLRTHVRDNPLRERGHLLLVRGLYGVGDVAAALAAYADARTTLVEHLGIEPGPDLQSLHRAILNRDPLPGTSRPSVAVKPGPGRTPLAPAQLPPDVYGFAGRRAELERLDDLLTAAAHHSTAVVISAIAGTAGVGKTAMAVHWGHRVRHHFPDGQLYINLRGFDPAGSPVPPAEAVRGFLNALHVPPQQIPGDLSAQIGLYRSLLAGKRMLLLLDNARDADQVRPLLPGAPGCLALVTSRNQLASLVVTEGAHPLALDLLTPAEARALLVRRIGATRMAGAPEAIDEIITRCDRLPLALAIVAAHAATNPHVPLGALAANLRDNRDRLNALTTGDATTDLRSVFSWSYRTLGLAAARLFRLLALHPGADIGVAATASLAGVTVAETRPVLAELTRACLVTEQSPGRYSFHDLLRAYATELVHIHDSDTDRRAATRRLLDHYLHSAHAAALRIRPHREPIQLSPSAPGVHPELLADHGEAVTWFNAEHSGLVAVVAHAAATRFEEHASGLAWALNDYLEKRGLWDDWNTTQHIALDCGRRRGDRWVEATAHRSLGRAAAHAGRTDEAIAHELEALAIFEQLGDQGGQAHAVFNIAWVLDLQGRYEQSLHQVRRTHELFRAAGNRSGQATSLNAMGWLQMRTGDDAAALESCTKALTLQQAIDDHFGEAATWDSLGYLRYRRGEHQTANGCYERALALYRELADRYVEPIVLRHIGDNHEAAGDIESARRAWREALEILSDIGHHPEAEQIRQKLDSTDLCVGHGSGRAEVTVPSD